MTDYSKLKVTELKEELKDRKISLSGLKVKRDFIDKLLEADAAKASSDCLAVTGGTGKEVASVRDVATQDEQSPVATTETAGRSQTGNSPKHQLTGKESQDSTTSLGTIAAVEDDRSQNNEVMKEKSEAPLATESQETTANHPLLTSSIEVGADEPHQQPVLTLTNVSAPSSIPPVDQPPSQYESDRANTPQSHLAQPSSARTPSSSQTTSAELHEDSRKRKRRSVTPAPSSIEIAQKKAKASDGSPRVTQKEGSILAGASPPSNEVEVCTNSHEVQQGALKNSSPVEDRFNSASQFEPVGPSEKARSRSPATPIRSPQRDEQSLEHAQENQGAPWRSPVPSKLHSPSVRKRQSPTPAKPFIREDDPAAPALHPATSSLYIRNFKRPLHIPSLRSHISNLAASPNMDAGYEPIVSFYLDSVRTHAFVSFTSIAAASRVRSALHDSRFPDEMTREPLWVDFVPGEKIEEWIGREQQANGGGRNGRRWEVVYQDGSDGMEAIHREVGSGSEAGPAPQRRPSAPFGSRDSGNAAGPSTILGVHPDRARLVASEDDVSRRKGSNLQPDQRPEQIGTGFRALDDLFPSTKAKPKLYYKQVDPDVAEERLDMIRDLRKVVGAKSGDPDMRRYSFEVDNGREEWVDKGPEFGYGARGRAVERGGRGGYRGRAGPARGGETWRSGGRY